MSSNQSTPDANRSSNAVNQDVLKVIQFSCPFEFQILGEPTVAQIISGTPFTNAGVGREISFADVIAIIACAAAVAQVVLTLWPPRKSSSSNEQSSGSISTAEPTVAMLQKHFERHVEIQELLSKDPDFLARILEAVRRLKDRE